MKESISISKLVKDVKNDALVRSCGIPLEYVAGTPVFRVQKSKVYLIIPFLRYKVTGIVDQTYVYPIRYTVTVMLPENKIVSFEDLASNSHFRKVDFNRPIGLFRHESVKKYSQKQFKEEKKKLYDLYDKIVNSILDTKSCAKTDVEDLANLLNVLLEPSLKPIYKAIDKQFYDNFLQK